MEPEPGFLERLRELTERYGVVLVFDEILTGFRINLGGAQAEYKLIPDLACFGKAMANGMPISAIVGRDEIMKRMTDIFFSGTFGGEALSLAAAVATIDKLISQDAVHRMRVHGARLKELINGLVSKHRLSSVIKLAAAPIGCQLQRSSIAQSSLISYIASYAKSWLRMAFLDKTHLVSVSLTSTTALRWRRAQLSSANSQRPSPLPLMIKIQEVICGAR